MLNKNLGNKLTSSHKESKKLTVNELRSLVRKIIKEEKNIGKIKHESDGYDVRSFPEINQLLNDPEIDLYYQNSIGKTFQIFKINELGLELYGRGFVKWSDIYMTGDKYVIFDVYVNDINNSYINFYPPIKIDSNFDYIETIKDKFNSYDN